MTAPAAKKAVYEDLYGIPENMVGEIVDGELVVTPRPSVSHSHAATVLGGEIVQPYRFGRGGPGGWIILFEPEIMLGEQLLVPDFGGWRKERFAVRSEENWISIVPDWVCEILSPTTMRMDRARKMPVYAKCQVAFIWLIDPMARILEAYRLEFGKWLLLATFSEDDKVRAEPFHEVEIDLANLWLS